VTITRGAIGYVSAAASMSGVKTLDVKQKTGRQRICGV
jgi:hypothetical protein